MIMEISTTWILVSGKRYAGKDTAADLIAAALRAQGHVATRTSFAQAVKADVAREYGLDFIRLMTDQAYKEENRRLLIEHGAAMRAQEHSYWVRKTYEGVVRADYIVVSDWRFPNESEWISMRASVIRVRVRADDDVRRARGWVPNDAVDRDQSECSLDGAEVDLVVCNNGDRQALTDALRPLLQLK